MLARVAGAVLLILVFGACDSKAQKLPSATTSPTVAATRPTQPLTVAVTATVSAAPEPLGSETCAPASTGPRVHASLGIPTGPFCLTWRDRWEAETSYRIELVYIYGEDSRETFEYQLPADSKEFTFPLDESPAWVTDLGYPACLERKDFGIYLYVQFLSGEELVDTQSVSGECPSGS